MNSLQNVIRNPDYRRIVVKAGTALITGSSDFAAPAAGEVLPSLDDDPALPLRLRRRLRTLRFRDFLATLPSSQNMDGI